jgi:thioesterase domain-containing protein
MNAQQLQAYLHENIPLARAMEVRVAEATAEGVTLGAPLAPNINHRETVFGGSAAAVATLAAWGLLQLRLEAEGAPARVVIQRSEMDFEKPIVADFLARCAVGDAAAWERFVAMLRRKGRARIRLASTLTCNGELVAAFAGDFVAVATMRAAT